MLFGEKIHQNRSFSALAPRSGFGTAISDAAARTSTVFGDSVSALRIKRWRRSKKNVRELWRVEPRLEFPGNKTNTSWTSQTDRVKGKAVEKNCICVSSTGLREIGRELRWDESRRAEKSWEEVDRDESRWEELTRSEKSIVENKKTNSQKRLWRCEVSLHLL